MGGYVLAYDLGTGGNKASLYDDQGRCLAETFVAYQTHYPRPGWHEQRPMDWWQAVVDSTRTLLADVTVARNDIAAIGVSGHSLGVVPLDADGKLLLDRTPIWSDSRPDTQTDAFFAHVPEAQWYRTTGNGFPAKLYSIFKMMWYRDHQPEIFDKAAAVIGTKDFINFMLTGRVATDFSYASGSGVYNLEHWRYDPALVAASEIDPAVLPEIVPSTEVLGTLTARAAEALSLPRSVKVVAGGVDNSCMALGARAFKPGRLYNSLGSSSWIAVSSEQPLLSDRARPYVFAHVVPKMFASAVAIFSAGSSLRWARDTFCSDLIARAAAEDADVYDLMTAEAATSPVGANTLLFNPSLAGGTCLDASVNLRGALLNLDLAHTRADILRAVLEGIAMGLRVALDELREMTPLSDEMLVVGGASRSPLWRQIFANVYNLRILKTDIDQQAAALGAAALAAVGAGLWTDFEPLDQIHQAQSVTEPIPEHTAAYAKLLPIYQRAATHLSELGDELSTLDQQ